MPSHSDLTNSKGKLRFSSLASSDLSNAAESGLVDQARSSSQVISGIGGFTSRSVQVGGTTVDMEDVAPPSYTPQPARNIRDDFAPNASSSDSYQSLNVHDYAADYRNGGMATRLSSGQTRESAFSGVYESSGQGLRGASWSSVRSSSLSDMVSVNAVEGVTASQPVVASRGGADVLGSVSGGRFSDVLGGGRAFQGSIGTHGRLSSAADSLMVSGGAGYPGAKRFGGKLTAPCAPSAPGAHGLGQVQDGASAAYGQGQGGALRFSGPQAQQMLDVGVAADAALQSGDVSGMGGKAPMGVLPKKKMGGGLGKAAMAGVMGVEAIDTFRGVKAKEAKKALGAVAGDADFIGPVSPVEKMAHQTAALQGARGHIVGGGKKALGAASRVMALSNYDDPGQGFGELAKNDTIEFGRKQAFKVGRAVRKSTVEAVRTAAQPAMAAVDHAVTEAIPRQMGRSLARHKVGGKLASWGAKRTVARGAGAATSNAVSHALAGNTVRQKAVDAARVAAGHLKDAGIRLLKSTVHVGRPVIAVICAVAVVFAMAVPLTSAIGQVMNSSSSSYAGGTGTLTGVEAEIAAALGKYFDNPVAIAAILGNLKAENDKLDPADDEVLDGKFNYSYERACGLFQYTSTSPGSGEYFNFKRWCSKNGKNWKTVDAQMEWTFSGEKGTSLWSHRWNNVYTRNGYYIGDCGVPESYRGKTCTPSQFKKLTDLELATYFWMACYEQPGDTASHYRATTSGGADRVAEAKRVYEALTASSAATGTDGAAAVARAKSILGTPYRFGGEDPKNGIDCSGLVCYALTGSARHKWVAESFWALPAVSDPKPGDIVACSDHHCGLYIGNGKMIEAPHTGAVVRISDVRGKIVRMPGYGNASKSSASKSSKSSKSGKQSGSSKKKGK